MVKEKTVEQKWHEHSEAAKQTAAKFPQTAAVQMGARKP
jgi:hypothetical protein